MRICPPDLILVQRVRRRSLRHRRDLRRSELPKSGLRHPTYTKPRSRRKPDLAEAAKWHLISRAGGETDLELDDLVNQLDPQTRAAAEKAAKPWLDEIAAARQAQAAQQPPQASQGGAQGNTQGKR